MSNRIELSFLTDAPWDERELEELRAEFMSTVHGMDDDAIEDSDEIKYETAEQVKNRAKEVLDAIQASATVRFTLDGADTVVDLSEK